MTRSQYLAHLAKAIKATHGCNSKHLEQVPVCETFQGKKVWEGNVEVFDLVGHTKAQRCYAGLLAGFSHDNHPQTMSIEIKIRKNEPIDRALRRMKKKLDRENIIKGTRAKRYYEKPCEKRRRKEKVMAFTAMLAAATTADAPPPILKPRPDPVGRGFFSCKSAASL
jgi:small subunit ribosomal protein S21